MTWKLVNRIRELSAILLAAFMLSGCFTSQSPLITPDNADYPFQSITFVNVSEPGGDAEQITIVRDGDDYVELAEEDEGQYRLVRVAPDLYVAQLAEEGYKGKIGLLYGVVQIKNNAIMNILSPTCEDTPEDILTAVGIEKTDRRVTGECTITSLDQLIMLARRLAETDIKRDVYRITKLVE